MKDNSKMGLSDSLIAAARAIMEKEHTVPKSPKEKALAKLAHPKDKITHKDVLVGRGVLKKENSGDRMGVIVGTRKEKVEIEPKLKESEQVDERKLTGAETSKKEKLVLSLKKKMGGFKKRYGERAKEVMYATATKMAKNEEVEQVDEMDKSGRPPGKEVSHSQYLAIKKAEGEKAKQDAAKMTPRQRERAALIGKKFGMKEDIKQVDEISTAMASRYINKTKDDDTRKAGRTLALKKKWGGKVGGTEAPKVPTKD